MKRMSQSQSQKPLVRLLTIEMDRVLIGLKWLNGLDYCTVRLYYN